MTAYGPGTVAVATVRGVPNVRVMRYPAIARPAWISATRVSDVISHSDKDVTDVRPLVVLDLEAARPGGVEHGEVVRAAVESLRKSPYLSDARLADQIEAQTKPPRIPEPGLWGVVSVQNDDDLTDYWTNGPGGWFNERGEIGEWHHLPNPVLVRDGVDTP